MNVPNTKEARSCPACDSRLVRKEFEERISLAELSEFSYASRKTPEYMHPRLWECAQCLSLYAPYPASQSLLLQEYERANFGSGQEAADAALSYADLAEQFFSLSGRTVIDIGAGDGAFLLQCKNRGAAGVLGVEPSIAAIRSADDEIKPYLAQGHLEQVEREQKFDLATLFMTIEHVVNPSDTIATISEYLNDGGHLMVVCHNRRSVINRVLGRRSPIFDIEHMQMFTKKGVAQLMERMNFNVENVQSFSNTYQLSYWLRLFPIPATLKDSINRLPERVQQLRIKLNVGNMLVIAQKKTQKS